ncbi:MAG: DUF6056 family protein [Eubacteriales bacterium]|nr:DUF6056 family protein [Eubacteriales bacterium]
MGKKTDRGISSGNGTAGCGQNRLCRIAVWISYRKLAVLAGIGFALSLCPILWLSFYNYATGDDLGYGAAVRRILVSGGSPAEIPGAVAAQIRDSYGSWQGTWSSIALFCLEPSIWGEKAYVVVPWIALLFLLGGTLYLLHLLLVRRMGMRRDVFFLLYFVLAFFTVQYMPYVRGGLFWYTSVAHYVIPYGTALCCIAWSMRWVETGKKRFFFPLVLGMAYLGGAGYPPLALAGAAVFLIAVWALWWEKTAGNRGQKPGIRRVLWLFLPLLLEGIGFIISAKAPGNAVRGGEEFGFSLSAVAMTIRLSVAEGVSGAIGYFLAARPLFLFVLLLVIAVWETYEPKSGENAFRHPVRAAAVCFLLTCVVRMPGIYAGVEVSGGLPDVVFFTFLLMMTIGLSYLICWAKCRRMQRKSGQKEAGHIAERGGSDVMADSFRAEAFAVRIRLPFLAAALVFCLVCGRYLIGNTVDYTCLTFASSGQLADYEAQMQERLALLGDDSVSDVVVPEMNSEQGPFMHMALLRDPDSFTNRVTAEFYGKNSVVAIPREEYEAMRQETDGTK